MVSAQFPYLDCKHGGTSHTIWLPRCQPAKKTSRSAGDTQ